MCFPPQERTLIEDFGQLGRAQVRVCPAPQLTPCDWRTIVAARGSYQMWSGEELIESISEDPFDGRAHYADTYTTTHYIGTISTPGKLDKIITMRRVGPNPTSLAAPVIEDLAFWTVLDRDLNSEIPLAACFDDLACVA